MRIRTFRSLAAASLLAAGLVAWPGCNAENPDGSKNALGKIEEGAKNLEHKAAEEARVVGKEVKEGAQHAVEATGKGMEKLGQKLEGDGKAAAKDHLGDKAAEVVGKAGAAIENGGKKLEDSTKPKE